MEQLWNNHGMAKPFNCFIVAIIALLAIVSCEGRKGEMRIKGTIEGMNDAQLLVYSYDGGIPGIDTIRVQEGEFDWKTECTQDEATFVIIYPNVSTLAVFGGSGVAVTLEGSAQHLNAMKVSGTDANDDYTKLRMETDSCSKEHRDSVILQYIAENPGSQLANYLKHCIALTEKPAALRTGQKISAFALKMRSGRTIGSAQLRGKYVLIAFWAGWKGDSFTANYGIRQLRRSTHKPLECISYSLDVNTQDLGQIERRDSITWYSYCDQKGFASPLVSRLGITDIPYFVLVDPKGRIVQASDNIEDIKSKL